VSPNSPTDPPPYGLLIFGAGGSGREIAVWAERASWAGRRFLVLGLISDDDFGQVISGREVWTLAEAARRHPAAFVVVAVGDPRLRSRLIELAVAAGLRPSPPLVHPGVWTELDAGTVKLAEGVVVCPGSIVTTNVEIDAHAQVNVGCTIMHDCRIGAFSTLSPGVHLSGNNVLEPSVFVGSGAVTVQGLPERPLKIGRGAVIGAGAVVTGDVAAGATVVGVPARETGRSSV
jgi:sugar O-acyltransferase (sialic acid O-acetyltransferase NeuD family)